MFRRLLGRTSKEPAPARGYPTIVRNRHGSFLVRRLPNSNGAGRRQRDEFIERERDRERISVAAGPTDDEAYDNYSQQSSIEPYRRGRERREQVLSTEGSVSGDSVYEEYVDKTKRSSRRKETTSDEEEINAKPMSRHRPAETLLKVKAEEASEASDSGAYDEHYTKANKKKHQEETQNDKKTTDFLINTNSSSDSAYQGERHRERSVDNNNGTLTKKKHGSTRHKEVDWFSSTAALSHRLKDMSPNQLIDFLNSQIVGRSLIIETAFGSKLKLYCDYTASGQELHFMIDLMTHVEDYYANTHTETSATGAYMNNLLNEAEAAILKAMRASPEDYFVVGAGSGSTYAIEMAQKFLGTYLPPATREQVLKLFPKSTTWQDLKSRLRSQNQLPFVIVSHYEHHSNEITWRSQLCDVVECPPRIDGHIDLDRLEGLLRRNRNRLLIGSLSAGSNVTGLKTDIVAVASLLKKYNALSFFDYAAVGPYVAIDLSRKTQDGRSLIDGIYISPHKFLGGPGACGVLVFNRQIYNNALEPSHGGGGTVDYVTRLSALYTEEPTHREKSGTPGILQVIRAGLAFQLKSTLQTIIDEKERKHLERFYAATSSMRNLQILGPQLEQNKVVIMSFIIHHHNGPKGRRYLHQNFVVRLLNDIFGIQGRAGCSCAGPYGLYLLNIDDETSERFRFWLEAHRSIGDDIQLLGFKTGWARVNLHFTMTEYELDYLLFAIGFIQEYGHRFVPIYQFNPESGQWRYAGQPANKYPRFGVESLLNDKRRYAESETARREMFDRQRKDAMALLEKLPPSKELDSIPEMPFCYFYVEKSMLLNRQFILTKAAAYESFYSGGDVETPVSIPATGADNGTK